MSPVHLPNRSARRSWSRSFGMLFFLAAVSGLHANPATAKTAPEKSNLDAVSGLPNLVSGQQWKLAWNDEFNGSKLDETKWNIVEGKRNDVIRSRKAVSVDGNGHLVISIFREGSTIYDG